METPAPRPLRLLAPALVIVAIITTAYGYFALSSFFAKGLVAFQIEGDPTLLNYKRVLGSALDMRVLLDTLWSSFVMTIATLAIAIPLALVIVRAKRQWVANLIMLAIAVTFLSGGVTRAYSWLIILGNRGVLNLALQELGLIDQPVRFLYNWVAVGIAIVHYLLPFAVFTLVGVVRNLNPSVEEAARSLGASRIKAFWLVTMPMILPGLMVTMTLIYSIALASFLFPMMLGGGKVRMVANQIYDRMFVEYDVPFAAATSVVFLTCSFIVIWLMSLASRQFKRLHG